MLIILVLRVAVEGRIGTDLHVMRAETGGDLVGEAEIALYRIEARIRRAILRRHHQTGLRIGVIGRVAAGIDIAEMIDRAERLGRGRAIAGGIGIRVAGVGGRIERVEGVLSLGRAALEADQPSVEIALVLEAEIAVDHVTAAREVAVLTPQSAVRVLIGERRVAERRGVHRAGEVVEPRVQGLRRIGRVGDRDRQVEDVVVVQIVGRHFDKAVAEVVLDVRTDLATAIIRETVVAIAVAVAQEAADGVIGVVSKRPGLHHVAAIETDIADGQLRGTARFAGTADGDVVDDAGGFGCVDRGGSALHNLDPLGHQVVAVHAIARVEEVAVDLMVERQAVLLKNQHAAIGRDAAQPGDVLHLAAGRLDMDAGQVAEQVGEALGGELLDVRL
ncbi:hypothetical protein D9M73_103590 [compost metagenome]